MQEAQTIPSPPEQAKPPRLLTWLFPKTVARLQRIEVLRIECAVLERTWQAFHLTNFGATGSALLQEHLGRAMEHEQLRFWFMGSIQPLPALNLSAEVESRALPPQEGQ